MPLIYSVCATAQLSAGLGACEQALALMPSSAQTLSREMLVLMETAREHLLRLSLDWPVFIDEAVKRENLPRVMQLLPELSRALYGDGVPFRLGSRPRTDFERMGRIIDELRELTATALGYGVEPEWEPRQSFSALSGWLDRGEVMSARLLRQVRDRGWSSLGRSATAFLPALGDESLHKRFTAADADGFVAEPLWEGESFETSSLGRQESQPLVRELLATEGNGLMTRLVARLVELSGIPLRLRQMGEALERLCADVPGDAGAPRSGVGIAQIEAARGRLIHRVEIDQGVIRRYQILAPTEWNFHPRGVAAQGLLGLREADEQTLQKQAALYIHAVDPCVGFDLQMR